ncbi:MAG: DUF5606 domain-containing protein [Flavobacteriales bacterium]|jgi:hypothetical protein|nr:DUF5606 domain-containing protein [Flavobacteriales bacterium]
MDLSKIIAVAGKSGLFRVIAQSRQALIVESLEDGKRQPVPSSVRVSSLQEISMFTTGDDAPLTQVLEKLHAVQQGKNDLDPKAEEKVLWEKLGEALPDHDRDRIYPSDVRKLFTWYGLLLKSGEFDRKEEPKAAEKKEEEGGKAPKKAAAKAGAAKPAKADKAAAPKGGTASKPKATTMRKSAQRGS